MTRRRLVLAPASPRSGRRRQQDGPGGEHQVLDEDVARPSFERWIARRLAGLAGLAPGIHSEAERWTRVLRDGGPRSLPRREGTVWLYLNRVRPALLEWSNPYDHLREVTWPVTRRGPDPRARSAPPRRGVRARRQDRDARVRVP
ncbi:hypothetical protein GCM10023336_62740 [Streptomyces similanensis]|uniref:Uncharacterized protein n=1 Tax=Streptomyces similanensis TaxID=1274988 RepID=A0ABP9LEG3_9ACTN